MKALVGAFNQEKALVGTFSVIVQPVVEPMELYTALTRISGVPLAAATHREAVQLIVARARLVLTVLSGGLIPVKVRRCEPLTWSPVSSASPDYSSAPGDKAGDYAAKSGTVRSGASDQEVAETKLSITLAGHQGLGCSICKVTVEHNFPLFSVSPQSSVLIE